MLVVDVMVPFYPCFNFNFLLFLGMVTMIMSLKQKKMEIPRGTGAPAGGYSLCRWPIREVPPESGTVGTLKRYLFNDGYTKGVLLLSRMVQYRGKGRVGGGGGGKGLDLEAELPPLNLC